MLTVENIEACLRYCQAIALQLWEKLKYRVNFLTSEDFVSISKVAFFKFYKKFDIEKSSLKTYLYMKTQFEIYTELLKDSRFKISQKDRKVYFRLNKIQNLMVEEHLSWIDSVAKVLEISVEEASYYTNLNIGFLSFDELLAIED